MHLWNIDALTDELRTGKLTEQQSFRYFLFVVLFQSITFFLPLKIEGPMNFYSMGFGIFVPLVWLATGVAGLIVCFRANQQSDGHDFVRRIVCLAIPSTFRSIALGLPLLLVMTILVRGLAPQVDNHTTALVVMGVVTEGVIAIQCFMIYRRLRAMATPEPEQQHAAA